MANITKAMKADMAEFNKAQQQQPSDTQMLDELFIRKLVVKYDIDGSDIDGSIVLSEDNSRFWYGKTLRQAIALAMEQSDE